MKLRTYNFLLLVLLSLTNLACGQQVPEKEQIEVNSSTDTLTVAAGCFWCVEAPFEQLNGVISVESGYMGGTVANPSYQMVCTGTTGHAEAVQIIYYTTVVSYATLMKVFFSVHDPTQLNRQGADVGTQYRSAIFYRNDAERIRAVQLIDELDSSGAYASKIMTKVEPIGPFYAAENYHQDYFEINGNEPYCRFVIQPKMDKFQKVFEKYLKQ
jgi:peptide-methionine (S)-S-oxide reductase